MTKGHERAHFPTKEHMSFITVWLLCYPISQEMHAPIIVLNLISTSLFPFHSFTSTFLSYLGKLDLLGEMWTISSSPQLQTFKEALNVIWTTILIWCVCCHIQIASSHFHLKVKRVEMWARCLLQGELCTASGIQKYPYFMNLVPVSHFPFPQSKTRAQRI